MAVFAAGGAVFRGDVAVKFFAVFAYDDMLEFCVTVEEGLCVLRGVESDPH